jgi:hypothetical protein
MAKMRKVSVKIQNQAASMYVDGKMSTREIGRKLHLCAHTITRLILRSGIKMRTSVEGLRVKYPNGRYGSQASNWQGGKRLTRSGYIYEYKPDHPNASTIGAVMEHRLVMEKKLGRYLEAGEVVHHINGIKNDNRPENLEVMKRGKHVSNHFADGVKARELEKEVRRLKAENRRLKNQLKDGPTATRRLS